VAGYRFPVLLLSDLDELLAGLGGDHLPQPGVDAEGVSEHVLERQTDILFEHVLHLDGLETMGVAVLR